MLNRKSKKSSKAPFLSITIAAMAIVMLAFAGGCGGKTESIALVFSPDSSYVVRTTGVSTLISDSGVTRYRLITDEWLIYSQATEPYWYFPTGLYLEKFDSTFNVEGSVKADTAYYYINKNEWLLLKNVKIANLQGEKFDTEKLIWEQKTGRIHSEEFIRIEQLNKTITGYGFESNQEMTNYRIFNPQGIFPIPEEQINPTQTVVRSDSIAGNVHGNSQQESPMQQ